MPRKKERGKNLLNGTSEVGPFSFICRSYPCHVVIGAPSRTQPRRPKAGERQQAGRQAMMVRKEAPGPDCLPADARGRWTTAFVKREACLNKDATAAASFSSLMQSCRRSPAAANHSRGRHNWITVFVFHLLIFF